MTKNIGQNRFQVTSKGGHVASAIGVIVINFIAEGNEVEHIEQCESTPQTHPLNKGRECTGSEND